MRIMPLNKNELSDFNWGFTTFGILHMNGKYYFEVFICPKSLVQKKMMIIVQFQNFQHKATQFSGLNF